MTSIIVTTLSTTTYSGITAGYVRSKCDTWLISFTRPNGITFVPTTNTPLTRVTSF